MATPPPTILIVDGTADSIQLLNVWLQGEGYQTLVAISGEEALVSASENHPDLILMDITNPALGGLQSCRQLHANPLTSQIPIMLMTDRTPTQARADGLLVGAVDYIAKPVDLVELGRRASAILQAEGRYHTDVGRILDEVVYSALENLPCDLAWLLQVDAENDMLVSRSCVTSGGNNVAAALQDVWGEAAEPLEFMLLAGANPLADVVLKRQIILDIPLQRFQRIFGAEAFAKFFEVFNLSSISLVSLAMGERHLGILVLGTVAPSSFDTERSWQHITSLNTQLSIALDYAQLSENLIEQEEMMAAEQLFLNMILATMGDALIVIDGAGEIDYVNDRLLLMTDYEQQDLIGQRVDMLFHPNDRAVFLHNLLRGQGATMKFDQRLYTRSGEVMPVLLSRTSLARIDPESAQQVLVLSDLSLQKSREEALERQSYQFRALNQAADAISSSLSPQEVIQGILDAALEMVNAESAAVLLTNPENPAELVFVATVGPRAHAVQGLTVPIGQGIAGWVAREAISQLVVDATTDERFYQNIDTQSGHTTRSLIAVPLIVSDRVIGVLEVINKLSDRFDRVDMDLLESIAGSASVAIENARLFEQTRRRLNDLGTLLDASAAVSSTLDLGSVLELIARRLLDALAVERCLIMTWDQAANTMQAVVEVADAWWDQDRGPICQLTQLPVRNVALNSGMPVIANVDDTACDAAERRELLATGQQALMIVPLLYQGAILGLVLVYSSFKGQRFKGTDTQQVEQILQQWINNLGKQFSKTWQSRTALTVLCNELQALPGVMRVAVERWQPGEEQTYRLRECGYALWVDHEGLQQHLGEYPSMRRVLSIAKPKVVTLNNLSDDPYELQYLRQTGGAVCLMVPFIIRGQPAGLIKLIDAADDRVFDAEQISLGQGIANVVGNAMENANLYRSLERRAEALEAAYAELKQADQLKDDLLQNLSHEIQTPLLHILGYIELMYSEEFGPLTAEQQERLEFVIERTQHLSDLTRNIISVQALQTADMERESVDLSVVVQRAVDIWAPVAAKRNIPIYLQIAPGLPPVLADFRQLVEVVEHLLDNAIKFSPNNQHIEVYVDERGAMLEVRVRDYGIGIASEYHEHIFKRFYQVDSGTARTFSGTGLGLAIVQETIVRHNGRVWVESEPGQGSAFIFTLPNAAIMMD